MLGAEQRAEGRHCAPQGHSSRLLGLPWPSFFPGPRPIRQSAQDASFGGGCPLMASPACDADWFTQAALFTGEEKRPSAPLASTTSVRQWWNSRTSCLDEARMA